MISATRAKGLRSLPSKRVVVGMILGPCQNDGKIFAATGDVNAISFQFALERRTRREAADSAAARQGEATQLSFLMRIGTDRKSVV